MLSLDAHNPPKAEHLCNHDLDVPATSPLPAHSERRTLHRNSVPLSRAKPLPTPRLRSHARPHPCPNHTSHKRINSQMHSIHQRGYSFAARQQSTTEIWHSGYHEHRIKDGNDFNSQLLYIGNNPTRKQYEDYPHVHTKYRDRLDPIPNHLVPWTRAPTRGAHLRGAPFMRSSHGMNGHSRESANPLPCLGTSARVPHPSQSHRKGWDVSRRAHVRRSSNPPSTI
jgi:hypothetical protein